ncbi:hypothetical protein GGTG_04547 [Gaeumannomyces tritici R3-111a-1]|uniref:Retinol dehydrogenase 13 n=1 Tax=Gaeumannomyces tritici (strain R3-111a-1) TaxID=644352 RepID=J3NTE8_GAET3|nr:hypothetical protein GGTG_04547 [Gaeumannomyces tritici R3-111a-1]EJT79463.1 hypothetical protein GGTG_04547 [Gaeumannomyces tritici R3-111a-1]
MASHPNWGRHTTGTEVGQAFDAAIRGKNVVVTGVSPAGIGATTALAIAAHGPGHLILASRTREKLEEVLADINQKYPSVNVSHVLLDLGSLDSVRDASSQIEARVGGKLHVLINNAGVNDVSRNAKPALDGTLVDRQFFVNHLGPFLLTSLLLPLLKNAATAEGTPKGSVRVVNVSSHGHRLSPIRFSDLALQKPAADESVPEAERPPATAAPFLTRITDPEGAYPGFVGYGQSKCANVLHASELSRRLFKDVGILALSVHPGSIETELSRSLDEKAREDMRNTAPKHLWKSLDAGASTTLVAAFDPALAGLDVGGEVLGYLADCQIADELAAPHAKDKEAGRRLWEMSTKMLGIQA